VLVISVGPWFDGRTSGVVYGRSGRYGSTFAWLATALVGKHFTVTTSLRSLHSDPFEVAHLQGKSLILVSDSERYRGDLSVLKQLSGGDALKGRIKLVQGSFEIQPEALMLITANNHLDSEDTSYFVPSTPKSVSCLRSSKARHLSLGLCCGMAGFEGSSV